MADDPLRFRREASARPRGRSAQGLLVLLLLALGLFALTRTVRSRGGSGGVLIEVRGEVPSPGTYLVEPPTVAAALAAAGREGSRDERVLEPGSRLVVRGAEVALEGPSDPLLVALPIDVNEGDAAAFSAIPGVGTSLAERIVADRDLRGSFSTVDDLTRVEGIGRHTLDQLRPFVTAGEVPPVDVNRATAAELEVLPGVGPVLAARIVVDREDRGPFPDVDALVRVEGIGPGTVDGLRDRAVAGP